VEKEKSVFGAEASTYAMWCGSENLTKTWTFETMQRGWEAIKNRRMKPNERGPISIYELIHGRERVKERRR
jgi:hypothetical protein